MSGAVGSVKRIRNPVEAARAVMERTEYALLVGEEAAAWAEGQGLPMEDEVSRCLDSYIKIMLKMWVFKKLRSSVMNKMYLRMQFDATL